MDKGQAPTAPAQPSQTAVKPRAKEHDGGFGKYCFILVRLALLMPLKQSNNLLVRRSNSCGHQKFS